MQVVIHPKPIALCVAEVEQSAFNPANIVPGIGFSPDKMLQGRLFSYGDAQRYRLGVNHHLIPVNAARCPFHSYHRDGAMRVDGNHGSTLGYEPNSYGEWQQQPEFAEPPLSLEGAADHWNHREDDDYYSQPGKLFRLMSAEQQKALFGNTARAMGDAPGDQDPPHRQLPEGRSGLRRGSRHGTRHPPERSSEIDTHQLTTGFSGAQSAAAEPERSNLARFRGVPPICQAVSRRR